MADILPYLGVKQNYTAEDAAGQVFQMADLTGLTVREAEKTLKESYLTCRTVGSGDTVTGQIPAAGQNVPGDSQVLLYLGVEVPSEQVKVPDFRGMNRQQAADAAGMAGLYILVAGSNETNPAVRVVKQSIAAGTSVDRGSTIELTFTDNSASD
jgi:stage V sporulation protein D (sporulation-specific penicillin-binding protein)